MSVTLASAAPGVETRVDPAPVVAGCAMFALVLFLPQVLNDGDTLWQIRTGEWILDHRAIPSVDPFSFTAGNTPWFAHEWLAEVLMALAHRMGGMRGIMVLTAAASGLTAAVLLHHLRRFLPGIYAVLGLIVALSNAAPSLLARPHVLAWPCLALWCGNNENQWLHDRAYWDRPTLPAYGALYYDDILPRAVADLDGRTPY